MKAKTFLITGASGNLGSACVMKFISEGHTVVATVSPGKSLPGQQNLFAYESDLSQEISAQSVTEKIFNDHKSIHGAVLTVGGFSMGSIEATSINDIHKMLTLNFTTAYTIARPLLSHFKKQNEGRLVLVGSRPALDPTAGKNSVAYTLSKTLVLKLAELINAEGSGNIKASVIIPNIIDTPDNRKDMPNADFTKWLTPQAIANVIYNIVMGTRDEPVIKLY